jgi:hypothetical protein
MKAGLLARLEALRAEDSFIIIKALDADWALDYEYKSPVKRNNEDFGKW